MSSRIGYFSQMANGHVYIIYMNQYNKATPQYIIFKFGRNVANLWLKFAKVYVSSTVCNYVITRSGQFDVNRLSGNRTGNLCS